MDKTVNTKNMKYRNIAAKAIRIVTVPPLLITGMLVILTNTIDNFCGSAGQMVLAIILLGLVPILAYPLQKLLPTKGEVREEQRNLAFVLTFTGYLTALVCSILGNYGKELQYIIVTYFISMTLLLFLNKVLHVRASGHVCSVTGTLYFLSFFLGKPAVIPCICIAIAVIWSSLYLKRHIIQEIFWGVTACLPCIILSAFVL